MEGSNDLMLATGDSTVLERAVVGLRQMVGDAKRLGIRPLLATSSMLFRSARRLPAILFAF